MGGTQSSLLCCCPPLQNPPSPHFNDLDAVLDCHTADPVNPHQGSGKLPSPSPVVSRSCCSSRVPPGAPVCEVGTVERLCPVRGPAPTGRVDVCGNQLGGAVEARDQPIDSASHGAPGGISAEQITGAGSPLIGASPAERTPLQLPCFSEKLIFANEAQVRGVQALVELHTRRRFGAVGAAAGADRKGLVPGVHERASKPPVRRPRWRLVYTSNIHGFSHQAMRRRCRAVLRGAGSRPRTPREGCGAHTSVSPAETDGTLAGPGRMGVPTILLMETDAVVWMSADGADPRGLHEGTATPAVGAAAQDVGHCRARAPIARGCDAGGVTPIERGGGLVGLRGSTPYHICLGLFLSSTPDAPGTHYYSRREAFLFSFCVHVREPRSDGSAAPLPTARCRTPASTPTALLPLAARPSPRELGQSCLTASERKLPPTLRLPGVDAATAELGRRAWQPSPGASVRSRDTGDGVWRTASAMETANALLVSSSTSASATSEATWGRTDAPLRCQGNVAPVWSQDWERPPWGARRGGLFGCLGQPAAPQRVHPVASTYSFTLVTVSSLEEDKVDCRGEGGGVSGWESPVSSCASSRSATYTGPSQGNDQEGSCQEVHVAVRRARADHGLDSSTSLSMASSSSSSLSSSSPAGSHRVPLSPAESVPRPSHPFPRSVAITEEAAAAVADANAAASHAEPHVSTFDWASGETVTVPRSCGDPSPYRRALAQMCFSERELLHVRPLFRPPSKRTARRRRGRRVCVRTCVDGRTLVWLGDTRKRPALMISEDCRRVTCRTQIPLLGDRHQLRKLMRACGADKADVCARLAEVEAGNSCEAVGPAGSRVAETLDLGTRATAVDEGLAAAPLSAPRSSSGRTSVAADLPPAAVASVDDSSPQVMGDGPVFSPLWNQRPATDVCSSAASRRKGRVARLKDAVLSLTGLRRKSKLEGEKSGGDHCEWDAPSLRRGRAVGKARGSRKFDFAADAVKVQVCTVDEVR